MTAKKYVSIILIVLLTGPAAFAQALPVVAAYSLSSATSNDTVTRTVNDLVFSFIRELRTYRMLDMRSELLPADLNAPDGADYLFYGTLQDLPDGIRLELVLKGGAYNVTRIISRVYENSNRILLESRMLVRDLFDLSVALPDPVIGTETASAATVTEPTAEKQAVFLPVQNMNALAGTWYGEADLEKIVILRGGKGVAIFTTGISVSLELAIAGDYLLVRQKGAANPRQFANLPDPVAKQAAAIAPPLEWSFLVSRDNKRLSGTKKTVIIRNDGQNILSMEKLVSDVVWRRD